MKHLLLFAVLVIIARAETGQNAWLRHHPVSTSPKTIVKLGDSPEVISASQELALALGARITHTLTNNSVVIGTIDQIKFASFTGLQAGGYCLRTVNTNHQHLSVITATDAPGVLHGAFAWIRHLTLGDNLSQLHETSNPSFPIRWVNQWDNLDGTIERGYGGRSIFFENNSAFAPLSLE